MLTMGDEMLKDATCKTLRTVLSVFENAQKSGTRADIEKAGKRVLWYTRILEDIARKEGEPV